VDTDSEPFYRDVPREYDRYTPGLPGDVEFYVALAREAGSVVELGVGTGRIAIPTARAGIPVLGIDREPAMLEIAREKAEAAGLSDRLDLRLGDMRSFVLEEPVPLVTIPFSAFLHNLTIEDQTATLAACHRALEPGGRLALNMLNPDLQMIAKWNDLGPSEWMPYDGWDGYEEQTEFVRRGQLILTTLRAADEAGEWRTTTFRLRYVNRYEMQHMLERAGFEVESLMGGFAGEPITESSRHQVWVARRR